MLKSLRLLPLLFIGFMACSAEKTTDKPALIQQYAFGKVNQLLVVADSLLWNGTVGDTFIYYFAGPYILTPQPEAIFDLTHFTPEEFSERDSRKEFRMILVLADMNNAGDPAVRLVKRDIGEKKLADIRKNKGFSVVVGKDKWAKYQTVIYFVAFGEDNLVQCISKHFTAVAKRINDEDNTIIRSTVYQAGEQAEIKAEIIGKFEIEIKVPGDFIKAKFDESRNALWLRRDNRGANVSLIVHKRPYTSPEQLGKEGLKTIMGEIGGIVSSWVLDSRLLIDDVNLPLFLESTALDNHYTSVGRGIWTLSNDQKGGPFVSYSIADDANGMLYVIYGFVFAPGEDKRNFLQEVEYIIRTTTFPKAVPSSSE